MSQQCFVGFWFVVVGVGMGVYLYLVYVVFDVFLLCGVVVIGVVGWLWCVVGVVFVLWLLDFVDYVVGVLVQLWCYLVFVVVVCGWYCVWFVCWLGDVEVCVVWVVVDDVDCVYWCGFFCCMLVLLYVGDGVDYIVCDVVF